MCINLQLAFKRHRTGNKQALKVDPISITSDKWILVCSLQENSFLKGSDYVQWFILYWHFYFRSTSVFSALEVYYENALYKFIFDIDIDIDWHTHLPVSSSGLYTWIERLTFTSISYCPPYAITKWLVCRRHVAITYTFFTYDS